MCMSYFGCFILVGSLSYPQQHNCLFAPQLCPQLYLRTDPSVSIKISFCFFSTRPHCTYFHCRILKQYQTFYHSFYQKIPLGSSIPFWVTQFLDFRCTDRLNNKELYFPESMHPLYPSGLDENGAGDNLYAAPWICYRNVVVQGTKFVHCSTVCSSDLYTLLMRYGV